MYIYKLQTEPASVKNIDVATFEPDTLKASPYYESEDVQYAVCPRCDNPIQIIGLYKKMAHTPKPYGKHVRRSVRGLAPYDQEAYDFCPLASPQKPDSNVRKTRKDGVPNAILNLLREQFDRVVYLLTLDTGIMFSEALLEKMLTRFLQVDGFLYPWASLTNLPWMFGIWRMPSRCLASDCAKDQIFERLLRHFLRQRSVITVA